MCCVCVCVHVACACDMCMLSVHVMCVCVWWVCACCVCVTLENTRMELKVIHPHSLQRDQFLCTTFFSIRSQKKKQKNKLCCLILSPWCMQSCYCSIDLLEAERFCHPQIIGASSSPVTRFIGARFSTSSMTSQNPQLLGKVGSTAKECPWVPYPLMRGEGEGKGREGEGDLASMCTCSWKTTCARGLLSCTIG